MQRRSFIKVIVGSAVAWPIAAPAQQAERVRRVGVLVARSADDPEYQARLATFVNALNNLGWVEGRNLLLDIRLPKPTGDDIRKIVAELVAAAPDVVLTTGSTVTGPLLQATNTIPVVFASVVDPVGAGFVESLARPGGNATGLMQFEYSLSGKWLELLKQIAPDVKRVAVLRDSSTTSGIDQFAVIQSVAPSIGVDVASINVRDANEVERAVTAFAGSPNGGLIVTSGAAITSRDDFIIALAARHRLPAVYTRRYFVDHGGLASYGPDVIALSRLAAGYVDRILKGAKPADLPVQAPTRYDLVINLKTAKALRITMPPSLLARADEVVE